MNTFPEDAINYNMLSKFSTPKIIEILNKKSQVTYLYEDQHYWDPDKKQTRHKRRCIGKLDPVTGQRIYNSRYRQEVSQQQDDQESSNAIPHFKLWALEQLQQMLEKELNLYSQLQVLVGKTRAQQVLFLAWYLLFNNNALAISLNWKNGKIGDYLGPRSSEELTQLLYAIDIEVLHTWQQAYLYDRVQKQAYTVFDLCATASYEKHNPYLQYGNNRDMEALENNTIILLANQKSWMPLSFQLLDGTMLSSRTINAVLEHLQVDKASILMLNRRFFSLKRIEELLLLNHLFVFRIPTRQRWLKSLIEEHRDAIVNGMEIHCEGERTVHSFAVPAPFFEKHALTVHLYYDEMWRESQKQNLFSVLARCKRELESGNPIEEHARLYETYFKVRKRSNGTHRVQLCRDPVQGFEVSQAGFWALITNTDLSSEEALETYEQRNAFERRFDNLMNWEDCRRLKIHEHHYYPGRVFLQLISEMLRTRIKEKLKHSSFEVDQALMKLLMMQEVSFSQNDVPYREPFDEEQSELLDVLKIEH